MAAPKLTPAQRQEMAIRFIAGEAATALGREYGVHCSAPARHAMALGLGKRIGRLGILTHEQKLEIAQRYANGEGSTLLGREYGVKDGAITAVARARGIKIRSVSEGTRTSTINHACFSALTASAAYWIGFLMGDGSIRSDRPTVSLRLKKQDEAHVDAFCRFVGSDLVPAYRPPSVNAHIGDRPITDTGSYGIEITSRQIVADLAANGVGPQKSLTAFTPTLANNRHYWRGLMDADGCLGISKRGYSFITLCGSAATIDQYIPYARAICPSARGSAYTQGKIMGFTMSGSHATRMIRNLYRVGDVALDRKFTLAGEIGTLT